MELCLREIDKCRPYFINILGTRYALLLSFVFFLYSSVVLRLVSSPRYGYVPERIPLEIRQKYKWLPDTDSQLNDKSVTEFEVMHGALNNTREATRSYFYFRKGKKRGKERRRRRRRGVERRRSAYITVCIPYPDTAPVPSEADSEKVEALKTQIRSSGLPVKSYENVKSLAQLIFEDLKGKKRRNYSNKIDASSNNHLRRN